MVSADALVSNAKTTLDSSIGVVTSSARHLGATRLRVLVGLTCQRQDREAAVAPRGRFVISVSGGHSPWIMLPMVAKEELASEHVHVFQVDERIAPRIA